MYWYKLDENNVPIKCSLSEYDEWLREDRTKKIVKQDWCEKTLISTVFLGLDHSLNDKILWETMVFNNQGHSVYQDRYKSHEDAVKGHELAIKLLKDGKIE